MTELIKGAGDAAQAAHVGRDCWRRPRPYVQLDLNRFAPTSLALTGSLRGAQARRCITR